MWYLIFSFFNIVNILSAIYPFLVQIDLSFNIIKLKGVFRIVLFGKIKFELKIRVKHGYLYINYKKKERKEKITQSNKNLMFFAKLFNQLYFREQLLNLKIGSDFGFVLDSCVSAVGAGFIDVLSKCLLCKIKNNKKKAHIFVNVTPQYNKDICNLKISGDMRISLFDIIYSLLYTKYYLWRCYEKNRKITT